MPGFLHQSNRCEFNYDPLPFFLYQYVSIFLLTHSQLIIKNLILQCWYNPYSTTQAENHQ